MSAGNGYPIPDACFGYGSLEIVANAAGAGGPFVQRVNPRRPTANKSKKRSARADKLGPTGRARGPIRKPTYTIDGQTVAWESYVKSLETTVDWCDEKLIGLDPFEVRSQGYT